MANLLDLTPRDLEILQLVLESESTKQLQLNFLPLRKLLSFTSTTSAQRLVRARA
jgi:hypothetical protein